MYFFVLNVVLSFLRGASFQRKGRVTVFFFLWIACFSSVIIENLPDFFQNRGGLRRKWGIFRRYLRALRLRVRFHQR